MRVESLNALVTAPVEPRPDVTSTEQVTDLKREHEAMLANLVAQLEEKEADLVGLLHPVPVSSAVDYHALAAC